VRDTSTLKLVHGVGAVLVHLYPSLEQYSANSGTEFKEGSTFMSR
jgi:hypothetical protein